MKNSLQVLITSVLFTICIETHATDGNNAYFHLASTNPPKELKTQLLNMDLPSPWRIKNDSNKITFEMTDTMAFCSNDISPIRYFDTTSINTIMVELTLESDWTQKRLKKTKKRNDKLIEYLKTRIVHYGDSIHWSGWKTNKEWVEENPMAYVRFVNNWTASEKEMIDQVVELPNVIVDHTGVFIWCNTLCVLPERKNYPITELRSQLNNLGIKL